jgi:hypothetical protein
MRVDTPFLREVKTPVYCITDDNKERLLKKLNNTDFDSIRNEERFFTIINRKLSE